MFQTLFYQPILNLLVFLYNIIPGHDIGIAIILLTITIKLLLLPLSKKSIKSQKSLQDLQPKIEEIKKKYKGQQEEMGRKMMELYKENKVNPFSSCLPLLIQMPFLIAVFQVFKSEFNTETLNLVYSFISRPDAIEQMSFLGDMGQKNALFAVLAGLAQFWQSKMMMTKRPQPKVEGSKDEDMMAIMNKQMLFVMPIMTIVIGMSFPGGLALYWLTTTLLQVLQQHFLFKKPTKEEEPKMINNDSEKTVIEGEIEEVKESKK